MTVVSRVGTLDVAQLALKAAVDDRRRLLGAELANVALMTVDRVKQRRERWAEVKAEATPLTDIEDALELFG